MPPRLNLDSKIAGYQPNRDVETDAYGLPRKPEPGRKCWFCWNDVGDVPYVRGGRVFCTQAHMRGYYGASGMAALEAELREAEDELSSLADEEDEAEDELRDIRDRKRDAERRLAALEGRRPVR